MTKSKILAYFIRVLRNTFLCRKHILFLLKRALIRQVLKKREILKEVSTIKKLKGG